MSDKLKYHMNMLNSIDRKVGGPGDWSYIIDALNSIDTNLGSVGISGLIELAQNAYPSESASGNPIYLDDGADGIPVKELVVELEPKQAGTGDPSPTNVRAISGYDGVTVKRSGKNLFSFDKIVSKKIYRANVQKNTDDSFYLGGASGSTDNMVYTVNSWAYVGLWFDLKTVKETVVTVSCDVENYLADCNGGVRIQYGDEQVAAGTNLANSSVFNSVGTTHITVTATIPADKYICLVLTPASKSSPVTLPQFTEVKNLMVELGSTATEYEPYQGQEYSITFPTNVGTVYGGTLNVTTGELVVDRYKMTVDGSKLPSIAALTNNYRIGIMNIATLFGAPLAKYAGNSTVCTGNWLPKRNQGYSADTTGFYFYSNTAIYVFFPKSLIESQDISLARQYFVDHPLDICYELETPITYQLTPTEVTTILGNNTISSDGDIQLTYRADTTMLIDKLREA